jgi:nicotinamide riboside transporter PnuC
MQFNLIGEILDTIFSLMGKGGRILNVYRSKLCFIIWMVCGVYWVIRDFNLHLYSQGFFCIVSFFINAYGFYKWKDSEKKLIPIPKETPKEEKK